MLLLLLRRRRRRRRQRLLRLLRLYCPQLLHFELHRPYLLRKPSSVSLTGLLQLDQLRLGTNSGLPHTYLFRLKLGNNADGIGHLLLICLCAYHYLQLHTLFRQLGHRCLALFSTLVCLSLGCLGSRLRRVQLY
eukprot:COSAG02_NODE_23920_length_704_cov_0.552066_1_plen_134_part_00